MNLRQESELLSFTADVNAIDEERRTDSGQGIAVRDEAGWWTRATVQFPTTGKQA